MDRRVDKTKKLLRETLVTLMEEKELRKITISEMTARANINRGTFYLHYIDIYDMVEKLGDEIIDIIKDIIDSNNPMKMNYLYLPVLV
ncbi:MAG: TetR/AcrR family transcriptional regulator, partial [Bacilli bacterium]